MPLPYKLLPDDHIRLLHVHPRHEDGSISCTLSVHSLENQTNVLTFVALSYVWGIDTPSFEIIIDNQKVLVRKNLWEFLIQTAPHDSIWIDALCVNQLDNNERAQQVRLMGQIYSQAEMVLAWLGPAKDSELRHALLDLVEHPKNHIHMRDRGHRYDGIARFFSLLHVLERLEYWSRSWVVQEFVMAKARRLVYGDVQFDPGILQESTSNGPGSKQMNLDDAVFLNGGKLESDGTYESAFRTAGVTTSSSINESSFMSSLITQTKWDQGSFEPQQDLMTLLRYNSERQCLEPRDRVYSLLGLAATRKFSHEKLQIEVDYTAPISAVLLSIIRAVPMHECVVLNCAANLRRLLQVNNIPDPPRSLATSKDEYIEVAGYIDAEIVSVTELSSKEMSSGTHSERWDILIPSDFIQLHPSKQMELSKSEEYLSEEWRCKEPGIWPQVATRLRRSLPEWSKEPRHKGKRTLDTTESTQLLLSKLKEVSLEQLAWMKDLATAINERLKLDVSVDSADTNPLLPTDETTGILSLVVLKFRHWIESSTKNNVDFTHELRLDYRLGIVNSNNQVSVRDRILSLSYSRLEMGFLVSEEQDIDDKTDAQNSKRPSLLGAVCWIDDPEHPDYGKNHRLFRGFESTAEWIGLNEYLYPKVTVKMTAEEILQMTTTARPRHSSTEWEEMM